MLPETTSDYVDRCIKYLSSWKAVAAEALDVHIIPMVYLSSIFYCSCLRNGLIAGQIDPSAIRAVYEDRKNGPLSRRMRPENFHDDSRVVDLYEAACCTLSDFLLQQAVQQGPQTQGVDSLCPISHQVDAYESLQAIGALTEPHHRLTWPFFILEFAERDPVWQSVVDRSLQRQNSNHRLRSAAAVLSALRVCCRSQRGLAIMLDV